ncbi:MAG: hypothetical protein QOK25_2880 [Thermoleophilaceae bacterium]|nr:hypothetical protein [Thermoleophilaceae bacterium]
MLATRMRRSQGGPPDIEKLTRKGKVAGLVAALDYRQLVTDPDGLMVDVGVEVRTAAAASLAGIESPAARQGLLHALSDPDESVRIAAIQALRERGDGAAVEPLMIAVMSWVGPERARSREEALEALEALGEPDVLRRTAADLAARSVDHAAADAAVVGRLAVAAERDAFRPTVADLVADLRDPATSTRARTLLVWLGRDSVDELVEALSDDEAQRQAARALGSIRDSRAVEPLCSLLLSSPDPLTREAAAWALGEIRDPSAVGALLAATSDPDYAVRAEASAGFDKMGNAAIAVAMSELVRPALENGAREPGEVAGAIDAEVVLPLSPPVQAQRPAPAPMEPRAPPPARRPVSPLAERAGPMLRRLLGRDPHR